MSPLIVLIAILGKQDLDQPQRSSQFVSYSLKAEPYKNEPGARLQLEGATVYTLLQKLGDSTRELWRITLPEQPIHTWVSNSGNVWVLADTTGRFGGPMGGRSTLWARRNDAAVIGAWDGGQLLAGVAAKGAFGMPAQLDPQRSGIFPIGSAGNEQFKLMLKNGAEVLVTAMQALDRGTVKVVQRFPKGGPGDDPLQRLFQNAHNPLEVTEPVPRTLPVRVWRDPSVPGPSVLTVRDYNGGQESDYIESDRWIAAPPSYVVRTPIGRYAWFEFTDDSAMLRFLNYAGKELQAVDLKKLGKFASAPQAEAQLNYRSIRAKATGGNDETFTMNDETGRQYSIQLKTAADGNLAVTAAASLGLDHVAKKEPDYPDAKLQSETVRRSDDGRFKLATRRYLQASRPFTQLTVSAKIMDPIEGEKEVQVWSARSPLEPLQLRISGSGRVYGIMLMPKPAKLTEPGSPGFAMLFCWDLDGKLSAGYNLAGLTLKWFPSDAAAIKEMDLSKLKCSLAGEAAERNIDGIPIQTWPKERLDYTFANGRTHSLFVSTQSGFGMPVFSLAPSR